MLICYICNDVFSQKRNLVKHWKDKRCKSSLLDDLEKMSNFIENLTTLPNKVIVPDNIKLLTEITNNGTINNNINNINNINIKIEINPVTKLDTKHIDTDKLKALILKYDDRTEKTPEKLNMLLSGYIKDIICDKEHPENHAIKYTRVKPPTYKCTIEDDSGNTMDVIKGLKDTCDLLTDPILLTLKKKMKLFLNKYSKDDKEDFDYGLYDTAIDQLRKELNNKNVRKALSSVLQNDILNDIEMKFKITRN